MGKVYPANTKKMKAGVAMLYQTTQKTQSIKITPGIRSLFHNDKGSEFFRRA